MGQNAYYGIDGDQGPDGDRGPSLPGPKGEKGPRGQSGLSITGDQGDRGDPGESKQPYRFTDDDVRKFLTQMGISVSGGILKFEGSINGGHIEFGNVKRP